MENKVKGTYKMLLIVDLIGIAVTVLSIIVTVVSIVQTAKNNKHQKSNRHTPK